MTDEKIEYRPGQIWYDEGHGVYTIRWILNDREHIGFWPQSVIDDAPDKVTRELNVQIEAYKSTLLYNPPRTWAVGDVVPADTTLPVAWTAWNSIRGEYQTLNPKHAEAFTFDAKIIWIDTKEN